MNPQIRKPELMIATLGVEPQVVTIALDALKDNKPNITEVIVLYTDHPAIKEAMTILKRECQKGAYPEVTFRFLAIQNSGAPIKDFHSEADLRALLRTLYSEIRKARQKKTPIHLCISGGRKVMAVIAMTVAQLLFGPEDQVWYLITEGWKHGLDCHLHVATDQVRLIPVPVLRWQEAGTLMQTVTELDDPQEMLIWYERLTRKAEERRQGEFVEHWLTPAERRVTQQVCLGLSNAAVAIRLKKQEQTVANQLRSVYEKLDEWLGYPDYNVDRNVLIARFAPYFATKTKG